MKKTMILALLALTSTAYAEPKISVLQTIGKCSIPGNLVKLTDGSPTPWKNKALTLTLEKAVLSEASRYVATLVMDSALGKIATTFGISTVETFGDFGNIAYYLGGVLEPRGFSIEKRGTQFLVLLSPEMAKLYEFSINDGKELAVKCDTWIDQTDEK